MVLDYFTEYDEFTVSTGPYGAGAIKTLFVKWVYFPEMEELWSTDGERYPTVPNWLKG